MTLAILCAGQGGQHGETFALATADAATWEGFNAAAAFDLRAAAGASTRFGNAIAQPLVCASVLATWSVLGPRLAAAGVVPSLVAGYSVGELAAHGVAGRLSAADTIALARVRAAAMDAASRPGDGLVALRGLDARAVAALTGMHGAHVAIVNGDDQWIVGGRGDALTALEHDAAAHGAHVQRLPVAVASHTPLLATAAEVFRERLVAAAWHAPARPVVAGVDGTLVHDATRAIDTLARQISEPVRWSACMDTLRERGTTVALELGPGTSLARLVRERHPGVAARAVDDFRGIDGIVEWVGRAL